MQCRVLCICEHGWSRSWVLNSSWQDFQNLANSLVQALEKQPIKKLTYHTGRWLWKGAAHEKGLPSRDLWGRNFHGHPLQPCVLVSVDLQSRVSVLVFSDIIWQMAFIIVLLEHSHTQICLIGLQAYWLQSYCFLHFIWQICVDSPSDSFTETCVQTLKASRGCFVFSACHGRQMLYHNSIRAHGALTLLTWSLLLIAILMCSGKCGLTYMYDKEEKA